MRNRFFAESFLAKSTIANHVQAGETKILSIERASSIRTLKETYRVLYTKHFINTVARGGYLSNLGT